MAAVNPQSNPTSPDLPAQEGASLGAQQLTAQTPAVSSVVSQVPQPTKRKFNIPKFNFKKPNINTANIRAKLPKIGLAAAAITIVIIVLALILGFFRPDAPGTVPVTPTPTPEEEVIFAPSPYADDSDVAIIEEDIKTLEEEMGKVNVREDTLRIPNLDWNVSFKK